MNRRQFITSSLAAGAAMMIDFPSLAKVLQQKGAPNIKIGILSDIHITSLGSAHHFKHALEYFRDIKVDGVLVAGDLADHGLESELKNVADVWFSVFPKNKRPDGQRVEPLFIYGNHDAEYWHSLSKEYPSVAEYEKEAICTHREKVWKNCFHEEFAPVYMKTIKGYNFIGAHWQDSKNVDGLAEFFEKHNSVLSGTKPFFYFQHPHPKNTCNGPWVWGQDDGTSTELLSNYHNCIAFSGHSHRPLNEEWDFWQGPFTSIGTASFSYLCLIGARENTQVEDEPVHSEMDVIWAPGRHGMIMNVYDDSIILEKREFLHDEPLWENWVIPLGVQGAPMSYENRAKNALVPQFNKEDKAYITRAVGKDREGNSHKQVTVHFPSVLKKTHGVRAFDYEVRVEARHIDIYKEDISKRVFSPKCYLGEEHDAGEVICVFAETELPKYYEIRFAVRPMECFGGKGNPIYTEWCPSRTE